MSKLFLESVEVVAESIGVRLDGTRTLQATFSFGRSRTPNPVIATAMHAGNAIVPICKAGPGVKTVLDLPMIMGTHAGEKP